LVFRKERLDANPDAMRTRREAVEHPFDTIKIDGAQETRADAEWSTRASRRRRPPYAVAPPARQNGHVACGEGNGTPAQLNDAGALSDEVKGRPSFGLAGMIGGPLRAEPAQLLQFRPHAEQQCQPTQGIDRPRHARRLKIDPLGHPSEPQAPGLSVAVVHSGKSVAI